MHNDLANVALTLSSEVYKDTIQPAAKQIGKGLETVAKTIHVALAPIEGLLWGYERIKEWLSYKLSEKLKNVPIENIVTPPTNVIVPAVQSLQYAGYDEIRELYANLIAASMNTNTIDGSHPAYVDIIKQLSPSEAHFLKVFNSAHHHTFVLTTPQKNTDNEFMFPYVVFFYILNRSENGPINTFQEINILNLDNLKRLGILKDKRIGNKRYLKSKHYFENKENWVETKSDYISRFIQNTEYRDLNWDLKPAYREVLHTQFGLNFVLIIT